MAGQPASTRFQVLLETALRDYDKKAGVTLADSEVSLAMRLQCCNSIDDISTLLQEKTQASNDLRHRDRMFKSIKATVSILTPISALASVADDVGLVQQKVLNACLTFLTIFTDITATYDSDTFYSRYPTRRMYFLMFICIPPSDVRVNQAANGVITSYDALAEMLESIEHFINRLRIYAVMSHSIPEVDDIVVKLMVELISTLALVTQKIKKRSTRESFLPNMLLYTDAMQSNG